MAVVRKKQDDKHLKTLREIVSLGGNRQCFDCGQRGPTYVNMTIGSFVCTRCSGLLRGITPPHRVKSISMATFSSDEIDFVRSHGNDTCAKTWLGLWDPKRALTQDQRDLMVDKYERKRYFLEPASPLKSLPQHTNNNHSNGLLHNGNISQSSGSLSSNNNSSSASGTPNAMLTSPANTASRPTAINNGHQLQKQQTAAHQFHTQFTPDDQPGGGLFGKPANEQAINGSSPSSMNGKAVGVKGLQLNGTGGGAARHGMSGLSGSQATNGTVERTANRLSGPPQQQSNANANNNNKFTPDGDFGTDFGASFGLSRSNGQRRKGNNSTATATASNGSSATADNANADFADFEHNVIFNAAAATAPQIEQTFASFNNYLSDTSKSTVNANCGWNVWQQYQLPYSMPQQQQQQQQQPMPAPAPEQNRWSLPMSLSSTSAGSLNSSGSTPFNSSSSSINSTPPVDRYAALKDLDMQLREVVKDTGLFTSNTPNTPNNNNNNNTTPTGGNGVATNGNGAADANPFKAAAAAAHNPFQAAAVGNGTNGGGAWATDFGSAIFANGGNAAAHFQQQQQQHQLLQQHQQLQQQQQQQQMHMQMKAAMFGGLNGYGSVGGNGFHHTMTPTQSAQNTIQTNNGFGMMQRNPFTATTTGSTAARSNNPFL